MTLAGRTREIAEVVDTVVQAGRLAGVVDADRLAASLRGGIAARRDPSSWPGAVDMFRVYARRLPGHFYEASAARMLSMLGRDAEASAELERVISRVLAGSGPRWLGAVADLSVVASRTGDRATATDLYLALAPYDGRLVIWGGAVAVTGPVSHYLGLLASRLERPDDAVRHFEDAVAMQQEAGALPGLAYALVGLAESLAARSGDGDAARAATALQRARSIADRLGMAPLIAQLARPDDVWLLGRDGDDWVVEAGPERARLPDRRGLHYLRALLAAPGREIPSLDLVAGGAGLHASSADPILDDAGRVAYRRRLDLLGAELEAADRAGDQDRAGRAEAEQVAILDELRRATGLGGRTREITQVAERARVNVTRTVRATIDRIAADAPMCGGHLSASVRTGARCRYEPAPGGPSRWTL